MVLAAAAAARLGFIALLPLQAQRERFRRGGTLSTSRHPAAAQCTGEAHRPSEGDQQATSEAFTVCKQPAGTFLPHLGCASTARTPASAADASRARRGERRPNAAPSSGPHQALQTPPVALTACARRCGRLRRSEPVGDEPAGSGGISSPSRHMRRIAREACTVRRSWLQANRARRPPLLWSDCTLSLRPNQWHVPASSGEWDGRHSRWRQEQHRRVGCPPPPMVLSPLV